MTVRRIFPNINKKKIRDRFCLPFRAVLCTKSIGKGTLDYSNMCKCSRENYKNIFQPQGKFNSKRNLNSPSDQKNRAVFRSRKTKRKESPPVSCCYPTNYIFHSFFFRGWCHSPSDGNLFRCTAFAGRKLNSPNFLKEISDYFRSNKIGRDANEISRVGGRILIGFFSMAGNSVLNQLPKSDY